MLHRCIGGLALTCRWHADHWHDVPQAAFAAYCLLGRPKLGATRGIYVSLFAPPLKEFQAITKASLQVLGPAGTLSSHQSMDAVQAACDHCE